MNKSLIILSIFCCNILLAQSSPYKCIDIKQSPERLACYDSFFAKNKTTLNSNQSIVKKEKVKIFTFVTKTPEQIGKKIFFTTESGEEWQSKTPLSINQANQFKQGTPVMLETASKNIFWMVNRSNNLRIEVIKVK